MCMLFLEIGMFVAGLVALIAGKLRLSKNNNLTGTRARIVGVILMLPLPLAFGIGLIIGAMAGSGAISSDILQYAACIDIGLVIAGLAGAYGYAAVSKPPEEPAPLVPPQEPPVPPA